MDKEIGKRIKKIRLRKGLSQEKFGEIIGVKKAAISKIENGENSLSKRNLETICYKFNINEDWIKTGLGDIFVAQSKDNEIRAFFESVISSDTDIAKIQKKFINSLISLDEEEWITIDRFMKKYFYNND